MRQGFVAQSVQKFQSLHYKVWLPANRDSGAPTLPAVVSPSGVQRGSEQADYDVVFIRHILGYKRLSYKIHSAGARISGSLYLIGLQRVRRKARLARFLQLIRV